MIDKTGPNVYGWRGTGSPTQIADHDIDDYKSFDNSTNTVTPACRRLGLRKITKSRIGTKSLKSFTGAPRQTENEEDLTHDNRITWNEATSTI